MRKAVNMRRIATWCGAVAAAVAVMLASAGDAQAGYDNETSGLFEVKIGPYHPMVDEEFDNGPYQEFFGDSSMLQTELEYDVHLWRQFGTLSLGFHAGYGRVTADMVSSQDGAGVETDDESSLRNIPLKSSLIYRYDYSAHNHDIPLVPVAKAGLNYNFWRVTDAGGDTMEVDGQRGSGGTAGFHATLGLHLHLDFFDPTRAASMGMSWGIENSFLFAEYSWTRVGVFSDDGINLGANHWSAGLAFEF